MADEKKEDVKKKEELSDQDLGQASGGLQVHGQHDSGGPPLKGAGKADWNIRQTTGTARAKIRRKPSKQAIQAIA